MAPVYHLVKVKSLSRVWLFATPWTIAYQAPPSRGFSRQEYWSGLPFPSPGDLPDPGIKPRSPALEADTLTSEPPGKPYHLGPLIFQQWSPGLFSREQGSVLRQREKKCPGPLKHSGVRQVHHHLAWTPLVKARHKLTPDLRGGEIGVNLLMGGAEKSQFNQYGQRQRWRSGTDFAVNL